MYYSSIGLIGIILGVIINYDVLRNRIDAADTHVNDVYRNFLVCVFCYYITDALWGVLYGLGNSELLFFDTTAYFFFMALAVLMWTRYVVIYLEDSTVFRSALTVAGWVFMGFSALAIAANFFTPVLFYFDSKDGYHAGSARYIVLFVQIMMFAFTVAHTLMVAHRTKDRVIKLRYRAVWVFGVIMIAAIIMQMFDAMLPLYGVGYVIGTAVIHTFVHEDENEEHRKTLRDMLKFEQKQKEEIIEARSKAYTDPLTGVKNSQAYLEAEESMEALMATGEIKDFGLIVFDLNGLKSINDTKGHEAGDVYIIQAANLIDRSFPKSPLFRIGGDEFVLFLDDDNYKNRNKLLEEFNRRVEENLENDGVVIAAGMDVFRPGIDYSYHRLFDRADKKMYDRKLELKEMTYEVDGARVGYYETDIHPGDNVRPGSIVNDRLTGLPNMVSFFRFAEVAGAKMRKNDRTPAILFMDLSGMKHYNSKYGFGEGNKLLAAFADLLAGRFGNDSCSRFTEDHFAVITADEGLEQKLRGLIEEWENTKAKDAPLVRIGVYKLTDKDIDVSTACDRAKYACDYSKNTTESYYQHFDDNMLAEFQNKQYILENFERALEEKWIEVYYQPIIRTINGKVCDEECLARWVDPNIGTLPPNRFISVLEEEGLIHRLDLYVLERVLEKIHTTVNAGLNLVPQSINLSRKDFDACDIVSEICRRVDASGVDHGFITIEITESTLGRDFDYMRGIIEKFHELGFRVWMDDFGSGYSSLDVLQSVNFDLIKFDQQFMRNFDKGEKSKIILTELMKMASSIGVDTLCEGVETEEQLEFLREVGCSKVQGFYFLKPIPLEELLRRYETGIQIGFENPQDSDYLDAIGNINLYDITITANQYADSFEHYFSTMPMTIVEVNNNRSRFVRNNRSWREFMDKSFDYKMGGNYTEINDMPEGRAKEFMMAIEKYCAKENIVFVDERLSTSLTVHTLIRRVGENIHTGTHAYAIIILAISEEDTGTSYENIARSLSADYFNLYYVNLKTDEFIEYSSSAGQGEIAVERRGTDFFTSSKTESHERIFEGDLDRFTTSFTKDNIVKSLNEQGSFNLEYRLITDGGPVYVSMKAVRMEYDPDHIIIGVSNVDAEMRQKNALNILRNERAAYTRLRALMSDEIVVMYSVDPETGHYIETSAASDFEELGITKSGDDFFADSQKNCEEAVHEEDRQMFRDNIRRVSLLASIKRDGRFTMTYRMLINGIAQPVKMRATLVDENEGERLIIGVTYIKD